MRIFISIFLLLVSVSSYAQLSVAKIFSDNMIFQRDAEIPIWGWASENTPVTIKFDGKIYPAITSQGTWKTTLPKKSQGSDYQLIVSTKDTSITFSNIAYGDVWLCGGQSNMEWYVEASINGDEEVREANFPNIRLFDVPHKIGRKPVLDIMEGQWQTCTPSSVGQFSGVGYFFGRKLHQELNIPIGLLGANFGGTVIETWMSPEAFVGMNNYEKQIQKLKEDKDSKKDEDLIKSKFDSWLQKFSTNDKGRSGSKYLWKNLDTRGLPTMTLPTQWESAGIKKLEKMDGIIWFVKEFNLTKKQAAQEATLSMGPIDDSDITWINGQKVGGLTNQWNKDRKYKIPKKLLKVGLNKIVVRIEDYVGGGGIYGEKHKLSIQFEDLQTNLSLAGKWHFKVGYTTTEPMPMGANFGPNSAPTLLYNGMIAPIKKFPIKGVIWYQGESNAERAYEYKSLKTKWIQNWREIWNQPDLPIIWVQLANYQRPQTIPQENTWAEIREAQLEALALPHTAMITAIDLGAAKTIHPLNKQEVGRRLALAALEEAYQIPTKYKSPRFLSAKKKRKYIDITFSDVYAGLTTKSKYGYVTGFTIAGKDRSFKWAKAIVLSPNTIRVYAPKGVRPVAVRYAWEINPDPINTINSEGYPLLPFRTDNWRLSTIKMFRQ